MSRQFEPNARSILALAVAASCVGCVPADQVRSDSPSVATEAAKGSPPSGEVAGETGVSGRSPGGQGDQLTASEKRMREQGKNFDRTIWEGALIGVAGVALSRSNLTTPGSVIPNSSK